MEKRYTTLRCLASTSEARQEVYDGRDYHVVPVVALVGDIVVKPLSGGTEFVPSSVLSALPSSWDNRPILGDHPKEGEATANTPGTLEKESFGVMFNTKFEDGKLRTEAWIDIDKTKKLAGLAASVLRRSVNKESVEVSVGSWVTLDGINGEHNGESFESSWTSIVPDHLAMLPEGAKGACSIEDGCGSFRSNKMRQQQHKDKPGFFSALKDKLLPSSTSLESGIGSNKLHESLFNAIRGVEPGFEYIAEIFQDDKLVVYYTWVDDVKIYSRTYTVAKDEKVTLNNDRQEVEPITRYEKVEDKSTTNENLIGTDNNNCSCIKKETEMSESVEENGSGKLDKLDRLTDLLETFIEKVIGNDDTGEKETVDTTLEGSKNALPDTEDGWVKVMPEDLAAIIKECRAKELEEREHLIKDLLKSQSEFNESALEAKPTDELKSLSSMLSNVAERSYLGQSTLDINGRKEDSNPIVGPWDKALEARKASK